MDNESLTDLRDKIGQSHSDMLKRMLGLNELPEPLLLRYFLIKKLLDKIDGFISPGDLVRIALDCGFNPETMRFEETMKPVETIEKSVDTELEKISDEIVDEAEPAQPEKAPPEPAPPEPAEPAQDEQGELEITDNLGADTVTAGDNENETTSGTTTVESTEAAEAAINEEETKEDEYAGDIPKNAKVTILYGGKIIEGVVYGCRDDDGELVYAVDTEEDRLEVSEDDIKVV